MKDDVPINGDAALRGWVPWSVAEFLLIYNHAVRLQATTHVAAPGTACRKPLRWHQRR